MRLPSAELSTFPKGNRVPVQPEIIHCPSVLVIGGHDPCGAGIQADIETASALGCRAASLVTCLTTQNSRRVAGVVANDAGRLLEQAACLLEDITTPAACKLGLIPSPEVLEAVLQVLAWLPPDIPVVVDPVLGATAGSGLSAAGMPILLQRRLLPRATLATPNFKEQRRLLEAAATVPLQPGDGPEWSLVTGADEPGEVISHALSRGDELFATYQWPRIDGVFHGSGCTLATAAACFMARGETTPAAVGHALSYTWHALRVAMDPGGVQFLPSRPRE